MQNVLLHQAALCHLDTKTLFTPAVLAGHQKCAGRQCTVVCKPYPARYGRAENVMTASLSSRIQQVLVVTTSKLDTKLFTAPEGTKQFGLVYKNTSGMG